jgi:hypothetical protein
VSHMGFERVYTVWDYYDGPRTGVADYDGRPHYYACNWDDASDEYADSYSLSELDDVTLKLALEQWLIWRRWEIAFHSGAMPPESHPGIGGKDARFDELDVLIKARIAAAPVLPGVMGAVFQGTSEGQDLPRGCLRPLEVEWRIFENSTD